MCFQRCPKRGNTAQNIPLYGSRCIGRNTVVADRPLDENTPLQALAEDVWVSEHRFRVLGMTIASRMTVARLESGALFVHSPVHLTPGLHDALDRLGQVWYVICPNRFHHVFAGEYAAAFPDARLYAAPGLARKRPDLSFAGELRAAAPWDGAITQVMIEGGPWLNEVVFYHSASRTLLVTDLVMNVGAEDPLALRLWARLNGQYGRLGSVIEVRLAFRDRAAARRSVARMMAWEFERIVPAHGQIVVHDAKARLHHALRWVGQ